MYTKHYWYFLSIPFKDVVKEVSLLRDELNEYKTTLEDGKPPDDLAEQMTVFIPVRITTLHAYMSACVYKIMSFIFIFIIFQNADNVLRKLESKVTGVEEMTSSVAQYFCDERPDFINKVFEELWNFVEVFQKCIKVRRRSGTPWMQVLGIIFCDEVARYTHEHVVVSE